MPGHLPTFDLQSHSQYSDGTLTPEQVVARAGEAGVELLALTDHDTVDGVREAARAASAVDVRLATGVEISAIDDGGRDLHILGYLIDDRGRELQQRLDGYRDQRKQRASAIIAAIRELGLEVEETIFRERAEAGQSIGRPHLAEAVVRHPANADRLRAEGRTDPSAFLEGYLIEGRPAFRPRHGPSVAEAIEAIHQAGGVAVWAHPFWDLASHEEVLATVDRFKRLGIDGVECFYATHDREQTEILSDRCKQLGLLSTGSSDFHGPTHREFSRFRAFSTYGREPELGPIADAR